MAAALALSAAVAAGMRAPAWIVLPLGMPALLLVPGFLLLEAIRQQSERRRPLIEPIETVTISAVLSVVIDGICGFALAISPWGFTRTTFLPTYILVTMGLAAAALRRQRAAPGDRPRLRYRPMDKVVGALLLGSVCLLAAGIYMADVRAKQAPMVEFYILDADGATENYNTSGPAGSELRVVLGIGTKGQVPLQFQLDVLARKAAIAPNGSIDELEPARLVYTQRVEPSSERAEITLTLRRPTEVGRYRLDYILRSDTSALDRTLSTWTEVR